MVFSNCANSRIYDIDWEEFCWQPHVTTFQQKLFANSRKQSGPILWFRPYYAKYPPTYYPTYPNPKKLPSPSILPPTNDLNTKSCLKIREVVDSKQWHCFGEVVLQGKGLVSPSSGLLPLPSDAFRVNFENNRKPKRGNEAASSIKELSLSQL